MSATIRASSGASGPRSLRRSSDLVAHLLLGEAGQFDAGAVPQPGQVGNQRPAALVGRVAGAGRHDQQQLLVAQRPSEELQEVTARLVCPVHVLDHDHQPARPRDVAQQTRHAVEQLRLGPHHHVPGLRAARLRQKCGDRPVVRGGQPTQPRPESAAEGLGDLADRCQRKPSGRARRAVAARHQHLLGRELLGKLVHQSRLADSGLTRTATTDGRRAPAAAARSLKTVSCASRPTIEAHRNSAIHPCWHHQRGGAIEAPIPVTADTLTPWTPPRC